MWIIKHKFIWLIFSGIFVVLAIVAIGVKGLDLSPEFVGGTIIEISYPQDERPSSNEIEKALSGFDFHAEAQALGEHRILLRTRTLLEEDRGVLEAALKIVHPDSVIERFNTIGPSMGSELRSKAILALVFVLLCIVLYVTFAFRKVSKPVSSWKYGIIAVVALIHDVIIPTGIFAFLDKDIGTLFVVGLLSILGLSVNDTIVVFDRIRENLKVNEDTKESEPFWTTVGKALSQTISRSFNTSLMLIVVLVVLVFVGPDATKDLSLVLLIGSIFGTYSSIFVASPLLILWNRNKK